MSECPLCGTKAAPYNDHQFQRARESLQQRADKVESVTYRCIPAEAFDKSELLVILSIVVQQMKERDDREYSHQLKLLRKLR